MLSQLQVVSVGSALLCFVVILNPDHTQHTLHSDDASGHAHKHGKLEEAEGAKVGEEQHAPKHTNIHHLWQEIKI